VPGALVIDFNSEGEAGTGKKTGPSPYHEDGFRLDAESGTFGLWRSGDDNYTGSPAFFEDAGQSTTLRRADGGSFDMISIELGEIFDPNPAGTWSVTFIGTYPDNSTTAPAVFTHDGTFGMQTFGLPPAFTGLKSVNWSEPVSFGTTSQYDNIAVFTGLPTATPTPPAVTPTPAPATPTPPAVTPTPAPATPTPVPPTPAPTPPPSPAEKVPMCKIKKNGAEKTALVKTEKVPKKLLKGLTLGECPNPSNGVVMCHLTRKGKLKNILVKEEKVTKRLGKGDTLGACATP
jgi:hypothetical protein